MKEDKIVPLSYNTQESKTNSGNPFQTIEEKVLQTRQDGKNKILPQQNPLTGLLEENKALKERQGSLEALLKKKEKEKQEALENAEKSDLYEEFVREQSDLDIKKAKLNNKILFNNFTQRTIKKKGDGMLGAILYALSFTAKSVTITPETKIKLQNKTYTIKDLIEKAPNSEETIFETLPPEEQAMIIKQAEAINKKNASKNSKLTALFGVTGLGLGVAGIVALAVPGMGIPLAVMGGVMGALTVVAITKNLYTNYKAKKFKKVIDDFNNRVTKEREYIQDLTTEVSTKRNHAVESISIDDQKKKKPDLELKNILEEKNNQKSKPQVSHQESVKTIIESLKEADKNKGEGGQEINAKAPEKNNQKRSTSTSQKANEQIKPIPRTPNEARKGSKEKQEPLKSEKPLTRNITQKKSWADAVVESRKNENLMSKT